MIYISVSRRHVPEDHLGGNPLTAKHRRRKGRIVKTDTLPQLHDLVRIRQIGLIGLNHRRLLLIVPDTVAYILEYRRHHSQSILFLFGQLSRLLNAVRVFTIIHVIAGTQKGLKLIIQNHIPLRGIITSILALPHLLHDPKGIPAVSALDRKDGRSAVRCDVVVICDFSFDNLKLQSGICLRADRHIALIQCR